jgi:hypothetical protein
MPEAKSPQKVGATRRRSTGQSARGESRVKAEAAHAVARSASLEAALTPCDPPNQLDRKHSRFVVKLNRRRAAREKQTT